MEHILVRSGIGHIFESLSDRQCRLILLRVKQGRLDLNTDILLREEPEIDAIELLHNQLPRLAEKGYITWDRESGEISRGPHFDEIEPLLELIDNHADELPPDWP